MSRSIFIVGPLLLMAITFSYSLKIPNQVQKGPPSPSDQCRDRGPEYYVGACKLDNAANMCENLVCAPSRGDIPFGEETGRALDGTWCGVKQICFGGTCVRDSVLQENPFDAELPLVCEL